MSRKYKLSPSQRRRFAQMGNTNLLKYVHGLMGDRTRQVILNTPEQPRKVLRLQYLLEICALRGLDPNQRTEETEKCVQHKSQKL